MSHQPRTEEEEENESSTELPSTTEKRKAEEESFDEIERNELRELERKYKDRYSLNDNEYKRCVERTVLSPPIMINYYGKNSNRDHFRDRGHHRQNYRGRDGRPGQRSDFYNRSNNWSNRSYNY